MQHCTTEKRQQHGDAAAVEWGVGEAAAVQRCGSKIEAEPRKFLGSSLPRFFFLLRLLFIQVALLEFFEVARSTRSSGGPVAEVIEEPAENRVRRSNRDSGYQWSNCGESFEHSKWRSPEAIVDIIFSNVVYIVIQHSRYCNNCNTLFYIFIVLRIL
ncbi:unnamed protein product [Cuscuta epithymum]|uniref:Uncharacterized protein n=1 Tax=Cuscuta epithymum TaxID=186058 RepID=A0AAV0CTY8_9ASTE|nr:unnamed protein product [Cuscuta epithymum]